ncbi:expressed unknown protein (Partial), partial [Seminavis robusta]|eukprot:Sro729_g193930.1 n/a (740) ;mRNA; f:48590-50900
MMRMSCWALCSCRLVLLLFLLLPSSLRATEFNTEVMARVQEFVANFMQLPLDSTLRTVRYHDLIGFPRDLGALGRDFNTRWLFFEVPNQLMIALEDGSFLWLVNDFRGVAYREPGNSYAITMNANSSKAFTVSPPEMEKYWQACVDAETGAPQTCQKKEGSLYVQCVHDCALERCPDADSQRNCSLVPDLTERRRCQDGITWCPQYTIEKYNDTTTTTTRGFVPRTKQCLNASGMIDQRPGNVLANYETGELGDCLFRDGSLVSRTLAGDYEYCRGEVCNTTFSGGYETQDYDPRFRSWYVTQKNTQDMVWSAPYAFFTTGEFGMTFTRPLYHRDRSDGKTVFKGVIAANYYLKDLSGFLTTQYNQTDKLVMIVEGKEPNNIIATSTGTFPHSWVLRANASVSCPTTDQVERRSLCQRKRVPILELNNNGLDDADLVFRRVFEEQKARDFPLTDLVYLKATELQQGDTAYASQGGLFEHANVKWHVFVILPLERQPTDAAMPGDPVFAAVTVLSTVGFATCLVLCFLFLGHRKETAVIMADWRFTCLYLIGCSVLNLAPLTMLGENTDETCLLRGWAFNMAFVCALSPLYVKVWRMFKLLKASAGFKRVNVTNFLALLYTLPIICIETVILFVFSFVDPPLAVELVGVGNGLGGQSITCTRTTDAFFWTQVAYHGTKTNQQQEYRKQINLQTWKLTNPASVSLASAFLVLTGCILAFLTRNLHPKYGEAKQLAFTMYNTA